MHAHSPISNIPELKYRQMHKKDSSTATTRTFETNKESHPGLLSAPETMVQSESRDSKMVRKEQADILYFLALDIMSL